MPLKSLLTDSACLTLSWEDLKVVVPNYHASASCHHILNSGLVIHQGTMREQRRAALWNRQFGMVVAIFVGDLPLVEVAP